MSRFHSARSPSPTTTLTGAANDDVEVKTRLLRLPDVLERTALSSSTLYRLVNAGRFPRPLKLTERSSAWVEAEVDAWIAERIRERG